MVALISFLLNVVASLFKSKIRLEAENAALRHQLIVLQREVRTLPRIRSVGCCACAESGHAAAPPTSEMNSRRFNLAKCILLLLATGTA
jgi:hypothetical protein